MAILFSNEFNIPEGTLKDLGVFNVFLDEDSHFFINIKRLQVSKIPEFANGYEKVNKYFQSIGTLLKASKSSADRMYREAFRRFDFPEVNGVNLGFSSGTHGAGFGPQLREKIIKDACEIIRAGSEQPEIFHLVGLFEENVGPDRLSDMVARIIYEEILAYTKRIYQTLGINEENYPDIRYKTAAMILLLTGMRRGELCGLEWSNIDFKEATITIERSVTTVAGIGVVDKEPKTESSKRVIAISDKLLSVLTEYKVWYDQYRFDMGDQWKETDRLFIAECGAQIYPGTVYTWVHKVCDAAGLPHRTVHSLRHTNITMQIAAGVPLVTVAGRAGHARTSTTTDIYSHFLKSSDKTAAEKLEQLFE